MTTEAVPSKAAQFGAAFRKYRMWAVVGAAVIIHLLIAARSVGPMYVFDEVGYVAGANVISGGGADWSLCGSSYAVGYSAVLAPLWWLPIAPLTVYQLAAFFSAALGALAIWPATALAQRFGATGDAALGIGILVTLIPARALMDNYVLAENPLTLMILCAALLALRVAQRGLRGDVLLLGTVAGLAVVMHARAVPLVAVTLAWLAVRAVVKRTAWPDALMGGALAVALALGGLAAQSAMGAGIFAEDSRVEDLVGGIRAGSLGEVLLGQAYVQVVSWSLLTALGLLACASKARNALRRHGAPGVAAAWWWLGVMVVAQAAFFVWVLASSADLDTRFDIPLFGRYLDPFVVPIAVLGAVTLWVGARKRLTNVALIASAASVAAYCALVLPRISPDAVWIPFAVPSLVTFLDPAASDHRPALAVAGLAAVFGCIVLWFTRGRAALGITLALVAAACVTVGTDILRVDPFEGASRSRSLTSSYVINNPGHTVTMAADLLPCLERNKIQLELAGDVAIVPAGGHYGDDLIVGPAEWPAAEIAGVTRVLFTVWLDAAVWSVQE